MESKSAWSESRVILNQLMEIARVSALAEMASGIAHELNQPLGAIATFSQAGERMLNRPEPLVARPSMCFVRSIAKRSSAGDGIQRIRRLFEQECRKRARVPDAGASSRNCSRVLECWRCRIPAATAVSIRAAEADVVIDRLRIQHVLFALTQNAVDAAAAASRDAPVRSTSSAIATPSRPA